MTISTLYEQVLRARFEFTMHIATNDPENRTKDGKINWDYVQADMHLDWSKTLTEDQLYNWFDETADKIEKA